MKTKAQIEAKDLLNQLTYFNAVQLTDYGYIYRCSINNETYVNVSGLYPLKLQLLKKYAKENGWEAKDLFPAMIWGGREYWSLGFLVRADAILSDCRRVLMAVLSKSDRVESMRIKNILENAKSPFSSSKETKDVSVSNENFKKYNEVWEKRQALLKKGTEPSIEECIKILKENGYKVMKPFTITQYEEI